MSNEPPFASEITMPRQSGWTRSWNWPQFPLDLTIEESWKTAHRWLVLKLGPYRFQRAISPDPEHLRTLEARRARSH